MKPYLLIIIGILFLHLNSTNAQTLQIQASYSVEATLVTETLADVAFRLTDNNKPLKGVKGKLLDETSKTVAELHTDEHGQGFFFFVPQLQRYQVQWEIDGKEYMTDFLRVSDKGYAWSIDNISGAGLFPTSLSLVKDAYTEEDLEHLSKMRHRIVQYSPKIDFSNLPQDPHFFITSGSISPVDFHDRSVNYFFYKKDFQGKNIPIEKENNSNFYPQTIAEDIKVWVERPATMEGDSIWITVNQGNTQLDADGIDLRKQPRVCVRYLLEKLPCGDVDFCLYDAKHRLIATRNVKISHYLYKQDYQEARKKDLDCRLNHGTVFTLIPAQKRVNPSAKELQLCFVPEGGRLVQGVRSQVAFSALNAHGEEVSVSGEVYSPSGVRQTSFRSWTHLGGSFFLRPSESGQYYVITSYDGKKYKFYLPEVQKDGWIIGIDCITQVDSWKNTEKHIKEWEDRFQHWEGFWNNGEIFFAEKDKEKGRDTTMTAFETRQFFTYCLYKTFWDSETFVEPSKLRGKYLPEKIGPTENGGLPYNKNIIAEDDIKIRLMNPAYHPVDTVEIALADDEGNIYDNQTVVMDTPEIWLRFPINASLPCGYMNCIVKDAKSGEIYCTRRFLLTHYTKHRDYTMAKMYDIRCILGNKKYTTAQLMR